MGSWQHQDTPAAALSSGRLPQRVRPDESVLLLALGAWGTPLLQQAASNEKQAQPPRSLNCSLGTAGSVQMSLNLANLGAWRQSFSLVTLRWGCVTSLMPALLSAAVWIFTAWKCHGEEFNRAAKAGQWERGREKKLAWNCLISLCLFSSSPERGLNVFVSWAGNKTKRTPASLLNPWVLAASSGFWFSQWCGSPWANRRRNGHLESPSEPGPSSPGTHKAQAGCCHRLLTEERGRDNSVFSGAVRQTSFTLSGTSNAAIPLLEKNSAEVLLSLVWFA